MNRLIIAITCMLICAQPASGAVPPILVLSPSGGAPTVKATLAAAATDADAAGKTVVVTSALSAVQSNISSATLHAWPADRALRREKGGTIGNTTLFRFADGVSTDFRGDAPVFAGTGRVSGLKNLTPQLWGAAADFVLSAGSGTNNASAFQSMFTAARLTGNVDIVIPPGKYLINATNARGTAIELGDPTNSATNIRIKGYGAELFMGQSSRLLGIYNSTNVTVEGLKIWGYTGGSLGSRANDHGIAIGYNSKDITIRDVTITNCLGDNIYAGGSMTDGTVTGLTTENLTITNCILKQRIGNGTLSDSGGTKSRWAISLVDVKGANIYGNKIYGGIDVEPNVAGQLVVGVNIHDNQFRKGPVTPQSTIGTTYWHDEPYDAGGTVIENFVTMTGPDATTHYGNVCKNNTFDYGYIQSYGKGFAEVANNVFALGSIYVAANPNQMVKSNIFGDNYDAAGNILFYGAVARNVFLDNINTNASNSMFGLLADSSDAGYNVFINNHQNAASSSALFDFTLAATDTYIGPVNDKPHYMFNSGYGSKITSLTVGTADQAIDWLAYPTNIYYLNKTGSGSLSAINNVPDGVHITLMFEAVLTVNDYVTATGVSGNIRPRGATPYIPANLNSTITFMSKGGQLFEMGRTED